MKGSDHGAAMVFNDSQSTHSNSLMCLAWTLNLLSP